MPMREADAQAAVINDFGERQVGGVDIVVASDHLQVRRYLAKEVIGLAIGQVAQAENLANLSGRQEFAKLEDTITMSLDLPEVNSRWGSRDRCTTRTLAGRSYKGECC